MNCQLALFLTCIVLQGQVLTAYSLYAGRPISHIKFTQLNKYRKGNNRYDSSPYLFSHDQSSLDKNASTSLLQRIKKSFTGKPSDGLSTRERLAKMGLSTLLSYGFVSNMTLCVTVSLAWFSFNKKFGKSPFAPGQWKGFLAVYAGFYVFSNLIRPIRIAMSVAVSPYFEKAINYIQSKTNLSRALSITLVVFLANVCGTLSFMSLGIVLASSASGVPVFP